MSGGETKKDGRNYRLSPMRSGGFGSCATMRGSGGRLFEVLLNNTHRLSSSHATHRSLPGSGVFSWQSMHFAIKNSSIVKVETSINGFAKKSTLG